MRSLEARLILPFAVTEFNGHLLRVFLNPKNPHHPLGKVGKRFRWYLPPHSLSDLEIT